MKCKKCGGIMKVEAISETKSKGGLFTWILLIIFTGGLALLFLPFFFGTKSKTKTYFVCQKCGRKVERSSWNCENNEV